MLFSFALLMMPAVAGTTTYQQPAYITNVYFCNALTQQKNSVRPDIILTTLKANDKETVAHMVINLVGNKGVHKLKVTILDKLGNVLLESLNFEAWETKGDDEPFTATARFAGRFPEGGIFFKVFDIYNNAPQTQIGIFRLMTAP